MSVKNKLKKTIKWKEYRKQKDKKVHEIMQQTGWSYAKSWESYCTANKIYNIPYKDYMVKRFFAVPEDTWEEKWQKIQNARERRRVIVNSVEEKTGWSHNEVINIMNEAKQSIGISFKDYDKYNFYRYEKTEWCEKYEEIKKIKNELGKKYITDKNAIIQNVSEATGWDFKLTKDKIEEACARTGCKYKEYYMYSFFEMTPEEQERVFLICHSNQIKKRYKTSHEMERLLCNKALTNEKFDRFLKRKWGINSRMTKEQFVELFKDSEKIIYKPLDGNRGFNVKSYKLQNNNLEDVFTELKTFPDGVVEEFVKQHKILNSLTDASVNTIRIVTISNNNKPVTKDGNNFDIAYAALRIGGGKSIVDNFHSGGIVAAIDLDTGMLITDGVDMNRNVFETHPATGTKIKGLKIPYFKDALHLVENAYNETNIEGYIGWDIAISETGPVLIEINLSPGVVLLSTPFIKDRKNTKAIMEKYLF